MADAVVPMHDRVAWDFAYHSPDQVAITAHERARGMLADVAHRLVDLTPPGREQSLMLTALEEAMMWANAAIARDRSVDRPKLSAVDAVRQMTGAGRQDG